MTEALSTLPNRPGGPVQDHELFDSKIDLTSGEEKGVTTPEGEYFPLETGEHFALIRTGNGRREPVIQRADGSAVAFAEWQPVCERRVKTTLERLEALPDIGHDLAVIYALSVEEAPELAKVDVVISDESEFPSLQYTGGFAQHGSESETGRPKVVINGEKGLVHYESLLKSRKKSAEISATKIGIPTDSINPSILARFIFAHELGHALDYLTRLQKPETYKTKREDEMAGLPVAGYNPVQLKLGLENGGQLEQWFEDNREVITQAGYPDKQSLIDAQEAAYRAVESEDISDQFAARVVRQSLTSELLQ